MVATSRKHGKTDRDFACQQWLMFSLSLLAILASFGCPTREANEVVIYCALDREFAEPVLADYEKETGLQVLAKYDVESTKTVGLANAIIAEKNRPRCDLFWNNEILHTLRLKRLGLLESFSLPQANQLPSDFRDPDGQWYGFAARARVLLVNTDLVPEDERPDSVDDLVNPKWAGQVGIAKPLFGTTATHAAVLFAKRGEDKAMEFFAAFKNNGKVLGGNKQVAQAVSSGEIAFGLTDTDDAIIEVEAGRPVAIVFPDQGDNQPGALLVPNTLCLIKGGPHPAAARRLAEKIVSRATEEHLARAASAQIPLLGEEATRPRILPAQPPRWMQVDFQQAADEWERVNHRLAELFSQT
jgi:iron(III) transport system substrate-binding protein